MLDLTSLWDFDDPAASEKRFRLAIRGASPRDQHVLMTQLARAVGLQGRYDDGLGLLDATTAVDPEVTARIHLERGRILRTRGLPDEARPELEAAVAAAVGCDEVHVDALHMLALIASREEQSALHEEALRIARASADLRARDWDASLLNNIGMAHADAGEWHDALAAFENAWGARERQGDAGRTRIARWMVAWALRHLDRTTDALLMQRALKAELTAIGEHDPHVDEELAILEATSGGR
ncbi:tetratricopeptide repeat protein [Nocardioides psychrotolerans]|uniref:tetratricopeptide repeat protein n=1 Tax=Nocardioides psychrotolerans TaxID=1005945 RepID=UPI0031381F17